MGQDRHNPTIHIVNPTGEVEDTIMEGYKKMTGWGRRKGLSAEQSEDFADYYCNPRGWYGSPEGSITIAPLEKLARKLGLKTSEAALAQAVENAWYGERRGHRVGALKHWAQRKGLAADEAGEFASYVENHWYGDPEVHRRSAMSGYRRRRMGENPLWKPLLPEPYQASLGLAEMEADAPHIVGALLGLGTTGLYSGLGELATKNDWAGTVFGLGLGLGQSELTRRWMPTIGTSTEAEVIKQRAGFARGQRLAVYSVSGVRCVTSLIKMAAGVGTQKGALGQGLDDITKRIKEGKILDAVKLPFVTGFGFNGLGAAIDEIEWPKLPEGFPQLGADWKWPKLGADWPELPEGMKKLFKKKEGAATPKGRERSRATIGKDIPAISAGDDSPGISAGDSPGISAGDSPGISAGDVEYPGITQGNASEVGIS